jgi:hypothetical protein
MSVTTRGSMIAHKTEASGQGQSAVNQIAIRGKARRWRADEF